MKHLIFVSILVLLIASAFSAGPAYVIKGAKIVPVSGHVIEKGSVVILDGNIVEVGRQVSRIPPGAVVIDASGLVVYPGLFDCNTMLGLTEVGQVSATNDYSEMGRFMPHLLAFSAIHVESEHIPVARANGITHVLTCPRGERIAGQAAIISLDGWTPEEMEISRKAALMINYPAQPGLSPSARRLSGRFGRPARPYSELKKEYETEIQQLKLFVEKARHYLKARETASGPAFGVDPQLEGMIPALKGQEPVILSASRAADIKAAVNFAREEKFNYLLYSGGEVWKVVDFLKETQTKVILGPLDIMPEDDAATDIVCRTPALLHEKGVPFAISTSDSADSRNLPYQAGMAVAYGLPYEAALRAVTLTPAELLGVAGKVGSIEAGKKANLVVAAGDLLDYQAQIRYVFINGRPVSLENRHLRLYEKYKNRK
ncbi:MAG: amidohydrolase family protein [Acidobacteriota bacterium]